MKLKQHREDVRLLKECWASHGGSPVFVDIARRYLNLIRAVEQGLEKDTFGLQFNEIYERAIPRVKRVLKDAMR